MSCITPVSSSYFRRRPCLRAQCSFLAKKTKKKRTKWGLRDLWPSSALSHGSVSNQPWRKRVSCLHRCLPICEMLSKKFGSFCFFHFVSAAFLCELFFHYPRWPYFCRTWWQAWERFAIREDFRIRDFSRTAGRCFLSTDAKVFESVKKNLPLVFPSRALIWGTFHCHRFWTFSSLCPFFYAFLGLLLSMGGMSICASLFFWNTWGLAVEYSSRNSIRLVSLERTALRSWSYFQ